MSDIGPGSTLLGYSAFALGMAFGLIADPLPVNRSRQPEPDAHTDIYGARVPDHEHAGIERPGQARLVPLTFTRRLIGITHISHDARASRWSCFLERQDIGIWVPWNARNSSLVAAATKGAKADGGVSRGTSIHAPASSSLAT